MTDLEIAKTLRDAAQYIRDHGWIQGKMGGPEGGVCAMGACWGALGGFDAAPWRSAALGIADARWMTLGWLLGVAIEAPRLVAYSGVTRVAAFNDHIATADEVIDLIESVALQHELRALTVTTLSQDAVAAVCDNTVPEAVNA